MDAVTVRILGVDPGQKGALAFLGPEGNIVELEDMPLLGTEINAHMISNLVQGYGPVTMAVVEQAHTMPKQGITGAFNYGVGYGKVLGVLATLDIPMHFYTAGVWKKRWGLTTDKDLSRSKATMRWPSWANSFKRVRDDGRAEAAFIALTWIDERRQHRRVIQR
jgi:crossover junction endodeoxyribonuclease RuvC